MRKSAIVIGGGFGGLASSIILAKAGWQVTLLEKNEQLGGRAGWFEAKGFKWDTGPSWYLMPDVFEHFFELVGEKIEDHLKLVKLQPSYRVFYKGLDQNVDIWGDIKRDGDTFESIEPGAKKQLEKYLKNSEYVYKTAMERFLYKNYDSVRGLLTPQLIREGRKLSVLSSMQRYVSRYFKDQRLQQIMQYPLVFLGASPYNAPALYNLMSHIDFNQGVFYPMGGMYELVRSLTSIAQKYGVQLETGASVQKIIVEAGQAKGVRLEGGREVRADIVISNADIHHTETAMLEPKYRDHSERYWRTRTLAPSALLMYLGVKGELPQLRHHNLLFGSDWRRGFGEIFDKRRPDFPSDPSLYICNPSQTDPSVAPEGHQNLFVLVPIAAGIDYSQKQLDVFADSILTTIEKEIGITDLRPRIVYKKLFCVADFAQRFNSLGGSGLGLAHTLKQTAIFRPANYSKKVANLYYVGANVHPGIGLPVTLISAELLYKRLIADRSSSPLKPPLRNAS